MEDWDRGDDKRRKEQTEYGKGWVQESGKLRQVCEGACL